MAARSSLISNAAFNMIYRLLNTLFPLITVPYLSRTLMAEGLGQFNFSLSIVNYFLIFSTLGIPQYGTRAIAQSKDNLSTTFSEIWLINFVASLASTIVYYGLILTIPFFRENLRLYFVIGLIIPLNLLKIDWLMRGLELFRYIAIRSIVFKVLSLVLIFLFVKDSGDVCVYALVYMTAIYGNEIVNWFSYRNYCKLSLSGIKLPGLYERLRPILLLAASQIAIDVYTNTDITMLGVLSGNYAVGVYTNAEKIVKLIVTVIVSLSAVLLPRISECIKNKETENVNRYVNRMLEIILICSIPACIGICSVSEPFVSLMFGADFLPAVQTMKIFSVMIPVLSVGNLFGSVILIAYEKEKHLFYSVVAGAVLNFSMNLMLIPRMAQDGAAIASVAAECIVAMIQWNYARRCITVRIDLRKIVLIVASSLVMVYPIAFIRRFDLPDVVFLSISITAGMVTYAISMIMLHIVVNRAAYRTNEK